MTRRPFTTATLTSLLLFVAAVLLWVRSYRAYARWCTDFHASFLSVEHFQGVVRILWYKPDPAYDPDSYLPQYRYDFMRWPEPYWSAADVRSDWKGKGTLQNLMILKGSWDHRPLRFAWGEGSLPTGNTWNPVPSTFVEISDWFIAACLAVPALVWAIRYRSRPQSSGLCHQCGYDLRASTDRCPECGTSISASDSVAAIDAHDYRPHQPRRTYRFMPIPSRLGFQFSAQNRIHLDGIDDSDVAVAIPFWPPMLASCLLPALWTARRKFRQRCRRLGLCQSCGYDLRASTTRCPEFRTPIPGGGEYRRCKDQEERPDHRQKLKGSEACSQGRLLTW